MTLTGLTAIRTSSARAYHHPVCVVFTPDLLRLAGFSGYTQWLPPDKPHGFLCNLFGKHMVASVCEDHQ